ncbi:ABC transporter permease [Vibrio penaeicida]|uniref:ABC transporter permease n=1 Tax=Vibrio penaeicida TaxID=104609 RepID=UPI000CE9B5C5|nr:iron ABC transporter permease [Vibrio penaeicida]
MKITAWKTYTYFCIFGAIVFIVLPQLWILTTSFQRDGGVFTIEVTPTKLALVNDDLEQFQKLSSTNTAISLARNELKIDIERLTETQTQLTLNEPIESAKKTGQRSLFLVSPSGQFVIKQTVVNQLNFGQELKRKVPFEIEVAKQRVLISHQEDAYLTFSDQMESWSLQAYSDFFGKSRYLSALSNSLIVTFVSAFFATALAVPLAWLVARYNLKYRKLIIIAIAMASVAPPFLGAYSWRMLLGSQGLLTELLGLDWSIMGLHGVIWVVIWLAFPIVFLTTLDSFEGLDASLRESALSLGASNFKAFLTVEVPSCLPGVITGLYMSAMVAFSDFGTPFILSLDMEVLPMLIYKEFLNEVGGNTSIASVASVVMVVVATLFLTFQRLILASKTFSSVSVKKAPLLDVTPKIKGIAYGLATFMIAMAFLPHVTVLIVSFLKWQAGMVTSIFTLQNYYDVYDTQLNSIWVSLSTAGAATVMALFFGSTIAYIIVRKRFPIISPVINNLTMLPYIIPGTVFAIGYIYSFNDGVLTLTGTWWILTIAYLIRKLPYAIKMGESTLYQVHPSLEEAATSLGAHPVKVFYTIVVPMILSGAVTGATLVFMQSVTELSATILLFRPPWRPMSAVLFEYTVAPGSNFGIAASLAVIMMVIIYFPLYFVFKKR